MSTSGSLMAWLFLYCASALMHHRLLIRSDSDAQHYQVQNKTIHSSNGTIICGIVNVTPVPMWVRKRKRAMKTATWGQEP